MLKEIRLFFESRPGVDNSYEQFIQKTQFLSDGNFLRPAGYIMVDNSKKVFGKMEPVFQMISEVEGSVDDRKEYLATMKEMVECIRHDEYIIHLQETYQNQNGKISVKSMV